MPAATLKGCTVALSGTFKGHRQTDLTSLIAANGAVHSKAVTAQTTHLVTTETDVAKPSTKGESQDYLMILKIVANLSFASNFL